MGCEKSMDGEIRVVHKWDPGQGCGKSGYLVRWWRQPRRDLSVVADRAGPADAWSLAMA